MKVTIEKEFEVDLFDGIYTYKVKDLHITDNNVELICVISVENADLSIELSNGLYNDKVSFNIIGKISADTDEVLEAIGQFGCTEHIITTGFDVIATKVDTPHNYMNTELTSKIVESLKLYFTQSNDLAISIF